MINKIAGVGRRGQVFVAAWQHEQAAGSGLYFCLAKVEECSICRESLRALVLHLGAC